MRHPPTIATHLASHASSPCAHRSGLCHGRYGIKPDGKHADCWHAGGTNHGCFLRFDLGGTPRITHVKTAVLQASAFLRIGGSGIDGGLLGAPNASARLHREYLTNGPGSIKRDGTYVGCASRYDDTDSPSAAARSSGSICASPSDGRIIQKIMNIFDFQHTQLDNLAPE